jgi:hypothetical protein
MSRKQFGDVANPSEPFPKMTRAVHAQGEQQIFSGKGFDWRAIEVERDEILPQALSVHSRSEEMWRDLPVQLKEQTVIVARKLYVVLRAQQQFLLGR